MTFPRIRALREDKDLRQKDLATYLSCSQVAYSYYELGCSVWRDFRIKAIELTLRAECINLTDSRYELVRNYPMPGRNFAIGLEYSL